MKIIKISVYKTHLPYVGGALVGGASLKSDAFQAIIEAAG